MPGLYAKNRPSKIKLSKPPPYREENNTFISRPAANKVVKSFGWTRFTSTGNEFNRYSFLVVLSGYVANGPASSPILHPIQFEASWMESCRLTIVCNSIRPTVWLNHQEIDQQLTDPINTRGGPSQIRPRTHSVLAYDTAARRHLSVIKKEG